MTPKTPSKKTDWRHSEAAILDRPGFQWIKAKINRFDHRRLESIHVTVRYPTAAKGQPAITKAEYRKAYEQFGLNPVAGYCQPPPLRSRKRGFVLDVTVYPFDAPWGVVIELPPLYRRPGGVWEPAKDAKRYAMTWDNDVLDAYAAICAAPDSYDQANDWADEHTHQRAVFGPLVVLPTTEYVVVRGSVSIRSIDDAIVFGVAQQAFQWLRKTSQIPGRISGHARDHFAGEHLAAWRKWASGARRRKAGRGGLPGADRPVPRVVVPGMPGFGGTE